MRQSTVNILHLIFCILLFYQSNKSFNPLFPSLLFLNFFYFFYVISIFTILYVFLRIFFAYPKDKLLKGFFQALFKFGGSYLLGMIMAAVTLLPMIITVLFSNRGSVQHALNPFYAGEYYKEFRNMADFAPVIKGPFEIDSLEEEELYRKSGCYLIYDSDGNLRYIGMSESNMLNRVKKHCSDSVKKSAFWINNLPHSVQIIETSASWEAPMIEAYLTHHAKVDK